MGEASGSVGVAGKIRALFEMTKPKQLALLMVTMYGAYFAAGGGLDPWVLGLLTLTGIGSAGGVTALNMYLEVDIDSVMPRTSRRPLPRGVLTPKEAIVGVSLLIIMGTLAGAMINKYVAFAALAGFYFDIVAYTELAKRRTEWALLLGSVAGSMPALGGWAAGYGGITLPGILLAGIVFAWQPLHVSFIHYLYDEQYRRAGVPTLPSKLGPESFAHLALVSVIASALLVWGLVAITGKGYATALIVTLMAARAVVSIRRFLVEPGKLAARNMIKYASPLVGIVFLLYPIECLALG